MKDSLTVFYSWQSDSPKPTNQNGIRQSLRSAINLVENEIEDSQINMDEATRNTAGSPNIPQTIFAKISTADIFVCDLTTINNGFEESRKVPNPNVLIELGYAIATIGWERIIMLFNTSFGTFPDDLPFDIDRHRASPYTITDKTDKSGKNSLTQLLNTAILAIINESPLKPHELNSLSPKKRKRELDVQNLKWIMGSINIQIFDNFIQFMPTKLLSNIFHYQEWFHEISISSNFHLYDEKLKMLVSAFENNWQQSLSFDQHFIPGNRGESYNFNIPFDVFPDEETKIDFDKLTKICIELKQNLKDLLEYIRTDYLEVDLDLTSKKAQEDYNKYHN